jgi:hypothetical protein
LASLVEQLRLSDPRFQHCRMQIIHGTVHVRGTVQPPVILELARGIAKLPGVRGVVVDNPAPGDKAP